MKSVLVLEDEFTILKLMRSLLKQYAVIEASTAECALLAFAEANRKIDLLIADVTLPESSGVEVALLLRAESPALPVVLMSGYPVDDWAARDFEDLEQLGRSSLIVLQKPFDSMGLVRAVRESLEMPGADTAEIGMDVRAVKSKEKSGGGGGS